MKPETDVIHADHYLDEDGFSKKDAGQMAVTASPDSDENILESSLPAKTDVLCDSMDRDSSELASFAAEGGESGLGHHLSNESINLAADMGDDGQHFNQAISADLKLSGEDSSTLILVGEGNDEQKSKEDNAQNEAGQSATGESTNKLVMNSDNIVLDFGSISDIKLSDERNENLALDDDEQSTLQSSVMLPELSQDQNGSSVQHSAIDSQTLYTTEVSSPKEISNANQQGGVTEQEVATTDHLSDEEAQDNVSGHSLMFDRTEENINDGTGEKSEIDHSFEDSTQLDDLSQEHKQIEPTQLDIAIAAEDKNISATAHCVVAQDTLYIADSDTPRVSADSSTDLLEKCTSSDSADFHGSESVNLLNEPTLCHSTEDSTEQVLPPEANSKNMNACAVETTAVEKSVDDSTNTADSATAKTEAYANELAEKEIGYADTYQTVETDDQYMINEQGASTPSDENANQLESLGFPVEISQESHHGLAYNHGTTEQSVQFLEDTTIESCNQNDEQFSDMAGSALGSPSHSGLEEIARSLVTDAVTQAVSHPAVLHSPNGSEQTTQELVNISSPSIEIGSTSYGSEDDFSENGSQSTPNIPVLSTDEVVNQNDQADSSLSIFKEESVQSLCTDSDVTEKQSSPSRTMTDSGTSYDFGSSVEDMKDVEETRTDNIEYMQTLRQEVTSDNESDEPNSAKSLDSLDTPKDNVTPELLGSRPSFGGLSAISSEGQRRLSFSDVESDTDDTQPADCVSGDVAAIPDAHESHTSSTALSSTDASYIGGSYTLETGQLSDMISKSQHPNASSESIALTLSTSISDDVFVDSSHEASCSPSQGLKSLNTQSVSAQVFPQSDDMENLELSSQPSDDAVSVPPTIDPLSSIIDFGRGELAQSRSEKTPTQELQPSDSLYTENEECDTSTAVSDFHLVKSKEMEDNKMHESIDSTTNSEDVVQEHNVEANDVPSIKESLATPSFESCTDFTSSGESSSTDTSDSLIERLSTDTPKFYRQEGSPPADESQSGSNNSIYDNLIMDDGFDPEGSADGADYGIYQTRQLSAVEELSENEDSVDSTQEDPVSVEDPEQNIQSYDPVAIESGVEPATEHSDITESVECTSPDDDVDMSSVDSYNTVIYPDGEDVSEDRLAEIASMTSSIRSDVMGGPDLGLMPLTNIEPLEISVPEPSTPRLEGPSSSASTPSEGGAIQKFPKLQDPDTVSVSSSLAEFEQLESQAGLNQDSPRASFYGEKILKKAVDKDQESISSSVLEFEHLETIVADSDSLSEPSPYRAASTGARKAVSTSSLLEFETLEVDVETEELQKEADKVVQQLEALRDGLSFPQAELPNVNLEEGEDLGFEKAFHTANDCETASQGLTADSEIREMTGAADVYQDELGESNTADGIQRIIDEASKRVDEMRNQMSDSVILENLDPQFNSSTVEEPVVKPEKLCIVMSENFTTVSGVESSSFEMEPNIMQTSVDSLGKDCVDHGLSTSTDSLKVMDEKPSVMEASSDSLQAMQFDTAMNKSADSIAGDMPSVMEKSLDSLSSEVIHEPYLQESPVSTMSESVQDMLSSTVSAQVSLMVQSTDSLGTEVHTVTSAVNTSTSTDSLENIPREQDMDSESVEGDHGNVAENPMTFSFHQSYPTALDPFVSNEKNPDSDTESRSTVSSHSSRSTRLREFVESDYRYEPRQKVFTMADVEAEREAKRAQKDSRGQSPVTSIGSRDSEGILGWVLFSLSFVCTLYHLIRFFVILLSSDCNQLDQP